MFFEKREEQDVELYDAIFKLKVIKNWKERFTYAFEKAAAASPMFQRRSTSWTFALTYETSLIVA